MESFFIVVCLVLLANLLAYFKARRTRRLAEARLEMAKVVLKMQGLMAEGHIKDGQVCHDLLYAAMFRAQSEEHHRIAWQFRLVSEEERAFRRQLHNEIKSNAEIGQLLNRFTWAYYVAFRNQNPMLGLAFLAYFLFLLGGFIAMMSAITGYKVARSAFLERWREMRMFAAEWCASIFLFNAQPAPIPIGCPRRQASSASH